MASIIVGNNNNILTAAFNASAKTVAISHCSVCDLDIQNLVSIYDTTVSLYFNLTGVTCAQSTSGGLNVYTYTFLTVPAGSANGDTLIITLNVPQAAAQYMNSQKATGATQ